VARCSRFQLNEAQICRSERDGVYFRNIPRTIFSKGVHIRENCDKRGKFTEKSEVIALQKIILVLLVKLSAAVTIKATNRIV